MECPQPCSSKSDSFCSTQDENKRPDARLSVGVGWSPPTKWPRASTPRRRDSLGFSSTFDSGYGDDPSLSFHSPPLNKTSSIPLLTGSPLLRTPKTIMQLSRRSGLRTTPSPLRSLQLSQSSPSLRPLQLSNPRNSVGFGFREADLGSHNGLEVSTMNRRQVNRCLQMPANDDGNVSDVMLSGLMTPTRPLREESPDRTLPYQMTVETPSKELDTELDDSGLFTFSSLESPSRRLSLPSFGSISAIHRIPEMTSGPLENSIYDSVSDMLPRQVLESPEPILSPPRKVLAPKQPQTTSILRDKLLKKEVGTPLFTSTPIVNSQKQTPKVADPYSIQKVCGVKLEETPLAGQNKGKRRRESDDGEVFVSPKKPLKPFSRRWMRIVCGTTRAQRELSLSANDFLKRLREGSVGVGVDSVRDPLLSDASSKRSW